MDNISQKQLVEIIRDANTFLIMTHRRPDGDAISSSLAFFWYLLDIGKKEKEIDVVIPEYNEDLAFISGTEHLKPFPTKTKYDLAILLDCAELDMLKGKEYLQKAEKTVCIDHHEKGDIYADYNIIDINSASCTSILYQMFSSYDMNFLSCIATGIISDTSNLTLNMSKVVEENISQLSNLGVDVKEITHKLTAKSSRIRELINLVLKRGKFVKATIFSSYLLQEDLLDNEKSLTNVNHKLIIQELQKEAEFETLILLIENQSSEFKVSMRTFNSKIDLNEVCAELLAEGKILKGGGHSYSAGCTVAGGTTVDEVITMISDKIVA